MSIFTLLLSGIVLLSILFAIAIVIEARHVECVRRRFLASIDAPAHIALRDWPLRVAYLIGAMLLAGTLIILPVVLKISFVIHE